MFKVWYKFNKTVKITTYLECSPLPFQKKKKSRGKAFTRGRGALKNWRPWAKNSLKWLWLFILTHSHYDRSTPPSPAKNHFKVVLQLGLCYVYIIKSMVIQIIYKLDNGSTQSLVETWNALECKQIKNQYDHFTRKNVFHSLQSYYTWFHNLFSKWPSVSTLSSENSNIFLFIER